MSGIVPIKPLELMNGEFTDFIGVWKNHMPKSLCKKYIDYFENILETSTNSFSIKGESSDTDQPSIMKGDEQFNTLGNLGRSDTSILLNYSDRQLTYTCNQYLQSCFLDYINHYGQLKTQYKMISTDVKMQKTEPLGGYHIWHSEDSGWMHCSRVLTWMIYLNDMPDGEGETEFFHQKLRIKPSVGTCIIWPASFTHVHRGLTVYSQNKYILTGWYIHSNIF
jgi:hypothetical protein